MTSLQLDKPVEPKAGQLMFWLGVITMYLPWLFRLPGHWLSWLWTLPSNLKLEVELVLTQALSWNLPVFTSDLTYLLWLDTWLEHNGFYLELNLVLTCLDLFFCLGLTCHDLRLGTQLLWLDLELKTWFCLSVGQLCIWDFHVMTWDLTLNLSILNWYLRLIQDLSVLRCFPQIGTFT